jgi:hypothetical protein
MVVGVGGAHADASLCHCRQEACHEQKEESEMK